MSKKKKRVLFDIIRIIGLLIAFSVLLYPTVSKYLYEKNSSRTVGYYDESIAKLTEEEHQVLLDKARIYNQRLIGNSSVDGDTFHTKDELPKEYEELLNVNGTGMMGYIIIPKINVELPIYHTIRGSGSAKRNRTFSIFILACRRGNDSCGSDRTQRASFQNAFYGSG